MISIQLLLSAVRCELNSRVLQRRWGGPVAVKIPFKHERRRHHRPVIRDKSSIGPDDISQKPLLIKEGNPQKPWEENVIQNSDYEAPPANKSVTKPSLPSLPALRPGAVKVFDIGKFVQLRPSVTRRPVIKIPWTTRQELEKRKKVLMEWTLTAQIKV